MELQLLGISATVDPLDPVVPKNIASAVRIVVRAGAGELSASDVARFLGAGYEVEAELSGPGLRETVTIPQRAPGEPLAPDPLLLSLPPLTVAGDYSLTNIRIVAGGRPVLDVSPETVTVKVIDQILVTSVKTRPLTLDEIKEKGIVLDRDDYLGFEFTMGLKLESKVVNLAFPVVFDRKGVVVPQPLEAGATDPRRTLKGPELQGIAPTIVPMMLTVEEGGSGPKVPLTLPSGEPIRIPSLLVIPGNVGFLKQFFSAQLFVANGAPLGSGLVVRDVSGTVKLPAGEDRQKGPDPVTGINDDPLSLPEVLRDGRTIVQPETLPVRGVGPDGAVDTADDVDAFNPTEQGQTEFLLRGEKEGFHPIDFDIKAVLDGLPVGPVNVSGKASGGVLVRNAFFNMTFTVPSVVRKQENFKLFLTVTNIGQGAANLLKVALDAAAISGFELGAGETGERTIPTLKPGDAKTLEFRFKSLNTGQVVASYLRLDTTDGSTGELKFRLGVGERGVPLSPDTLVLPTSVDLLPSSLVEAAMRVLGQGWSIANAPVGTLPRGVTKTSKAVVTQKALALAEAGLRVRLGQPAADAVRDLAFDFYGGTPVDSGFDQLLRQTDAGRSFALVLGAELAEPSVAAGGTSPYERELAQLAASGPDFMSFSASGPSPVDVVLSDGLGRRTVSGRSTAELPVSQIPGAVVLPLGAPETATLLGIVTAPAASPYTLELSGPAELAVTLPRGDGTFLRGTVNTTAKARLVLDLARPDSLGVEEDLDGDGTYETRRDLVQEVLSPEGPRFVSANVIGPETLDGASEFGLSAAFLFDRVVDAETASFTENYTIPANSVRAAKRQLSGRLVLASLDQPEGPYVPTTVTVSGIADSRGVARAARTLPLQSLLEDAGAVVSGRVVNADGAAVNSGEVFYANQRDDACPFGGALFTAAAAPLGADGRYELRYVRQNKCGLPFRVSFQDPLSTNFREVTGVSRRAGEQIILDIALVGRGSVSGIVRDLGGRPVPGAQVVAVSATDSNVFGSGETGGDGRYTIAGLTVGPVAVKAGKGTGLGRSTGRIERAGTTATVDVTLDGGAVRVSGTLFRVEGGVTSTVARALLTYTVSGQAAGYAFTADDGTYVFDAMPVGRFRISTILAFAEGVGAAGDNLTGVNLVHEVKPETEFGTVRGFVRLPDGSPAPGVIVARDVSNPVIEGGTVTGADGAFTLPRVAVGPAQVGAITRDRLRQGFTTVTVDPVTKVAEGVVIVLSGMGTAEFTVLDPSGRPLPNQEVALLTLGGPLTVGGCRNPCGCKAQTTGPDGRVRFANLPLGNVSAQTVRRGVGFMDVAQGSASIPRDGATGFGILRLPGSGTVTVVVSPPEGVVASGGEATLTSLVFVNDGAFTCGLVSKVSHRGQIDPATNIVRFTGVNVGPVSVTASNPFFPTNVGGSGTLTTHGQELQFNLKFVNTTSGELSGTVFLPDGATPAGAGVEVTANGALPDVTVRTDEQGRFRFAKIFPQGPYTFTARDPVTGGVSREFIFLRAAQDLDHDLRLKGRGTVRVRVVDGADLPVASAFVKVRESDFPNRVHEGAVEAANEGMAAFSSVFEGPLSVEVSDVFGRGGRASAVLPKPGDAIDVKVRLTSTGTVTGRFLMPDGTTPVPFGVVKLIAAGRTIGQTTTPGTGDVGAYGFDYVPAGPLRLEAQDPLTLRTGLAFGAIETEGQVLSLDVVAQGLGTVQGLVTSRQAGGEPQPEPGAHVDVVSGSYKACTLADSTGRYLIEGVPEGRVVVTASLATAVPGGSAFLAGTSSATLTGDGTTLTIDVALRDSAVVTGQVLRADGITPASISTVSIVVGGAGGGTQTATTDTEGRFRFERVATGRATLTADVLGSIDQGRVTAELSAGRVEVRLVLNGVGALRGRTLDSSGQPIGGELRINGTGDFPYFHYIRVGADGSFNLPEVLAGSFTASLQAKSGEFTLYGTASGTVAPDTTAAVDVQVQPSGTVTGGVLRPDGTTPAYGAEVTLELDRNRGSVRLQAQPDGRFTARGVPLGAFTLRASDPVTTGLALVAGRSLDSNGQELDLGTIALDDTPIRVVSIEPADGALGVAVNQPVRVTFSDRLPAFFGEIRVKDVSSTATLSADGLTVTLQGTWPDSRLLTVEVTTFVRDVLGRPLGQAVTSRFRTVDLSPPVVISVAPPRLAIQVDPGASVVASFSEPLSAATDLATLISLAGPAGAVAGTTVLTSEATATFTPAAPLGLNASYTVTVNGAVDGSGNRQTTPFGSSFKSLDTVPPTLALHNPAAGAWSRAARPTVSITLADATSGIETASSTIALDGATVAAPIRSPNLVQFTPAADLSEGMHEVAATVADRAGNVGTLTASFGIDTVPPSPAEVTGVTDGQTVRGTVTLGGTATDATSGVSRIDLLRDGVALLSLTPPSFTASLNTNGLSEGPHVLTARAVDAAGNQGPAGAPVTVMVDNRILTISITSPAVGTRFRDSVLVKASVSEPVNRIEFSVGSQTMSDSTSPYEATLDLASVAEGTAVITVTAFGTAGDQAVASQNIVVDRTPPAAPDAARIDAEPPDSGFSLVFGRAQAVEVGARVEITNGANQATASATAAADGSFAASIAAAVDQALSLVAVDSVGNRSAATTVVVRRTPSLPPSEGTTSLRFEGLLADRVGLGRSLTADGSLDAVFTTSLSIGEGITRQLSFIDLAGPATRSTRTAVASVLGVATDAGAAFLNAADGQVSFPVTSGATLTLFASADGGFIQGGATYTVTAGFTDGSRFVGSFTIVSPEDRTQVAHSVRLSASPAPVLIAVATPGTATLTLTDIRDIDGTLVPDGAKVAVAVADMASKDPRGTAFRSAGGTILDGEPAPNNASFRVFTIVDGAVTATYSSAPVTPASVLGAHAIIQVQAADAAGNVLGTEVIGSLDLDLRAASDQAVTTADPPVLYGDKADRRSRLTISVRDASGNPVPDGTKVLLTVANNSAHTPDGCCWISGSDGGEIIGGEASPSGVAYRAFTVVGGKVQAEYSGRTVFVGVGQVRTGLVQILPAAANGAVSSFRAIGTAQIKLIGAATAEIGLSRETVPLVFPGHAVQVLVHHVHDIRGNLVPDGANVLVTANSNGTFTFNGCCFNTSAGGVILDGAPSPSGSHLKVFPLVQGEVAATYSAEGLTASPGEVKTAQVQVAMGDPNGAPLELRSIAVKPISLVAPANAVGTAEPTQLLADGGLHTSRIVFDPVLDAHGNPLPDGTKVLVTAQNNSAITLDGCCFIGSAGGQVLEGGPSPSGSAYKVLTVQAGSISLTYADQGVTALPGEVKQARVALLEAGANGQVLNLRALGVVSVSLAGLSSAAGAASPAVLHADGVDRRSVVTISNIRDAAGRVAPDGTFIGVTATNNVTITANGCCFVGSAGGQIFGGTPASFGSHFKLFSVINGQVVLEYSSTGVPISSGQQTATVQVVSVTQGGALISSRVVATVPIALVAPASAMVAASPSDVLADSGERLSQITITDLVDSGGSPIPDGAKVGLTVANNAAITADGCCFVASAGGQILTAGTTPGDGDPAAGNPNFKTFTVAGGQVRAVYSAQGLTAGVNETKTARVAVVHVGSAGQVLTTRAFAVGTINLRGTTSATASGPTTLPLTGGVGTVTFTGIKDSAGNTVPDGTLVVATATHNRTIDSSGCCFNASAGGTITDGGSSPQPNFKVFTVTGGSVTVTYSTAGASAGIARVQLAPARPDGVPIGTRSLAGGVWAITVTN